MASGYAVIDVETTGLLPDGHDRVIELTVVHVDTSGRITGTWDTLVNPGRDLGVRGTGRIRSSDVRLAPTFAQIAPELCALLEGRVVVAHNARFAVGFVVAEFGRMDLATPATLAAPLCTMHLTRLYLPGVGRSLTQCASALAAEHGGTNRSAVDAWEAAELLGRLIRLAPLDPQWARAIERAGATHWPRPTPTGFSWAPRPRVTAAEPTFLSRLIDSVPGHGGAEHLDYLALIDRALVDGAVSSHDGAALVESAATLGIDGHERVRLNAEYFEQLVIAQGHETPTAGQLTDLLVAADLLGVDAGRCESARSHARGA